MPEGARQTKEMFQVFRDLRAKYPDDKDFQAALDAHRKEHPIPTGSVHTLVDHIEHIIHVAGINMLWRASERSIRDSVDNALRLAFEKGFKSIAFPLIGAGSGGFNQEQAMALMLDELRKFELPMMVKVVVFKRAKR